MNDGLRHGSNTLRDGASQMSVEYIERKKGVQFLKHTPCISGALKSWPRATRTGRHLVFGHPGVLGGGTTLCMSSNGQKTKADDGLCY